MNCDADILCTKKQNELRFLKVRFISFWRRERDSFLNFSKHSISLICYVLKNSSVTVQKQRTVLFFHCVRIPLYSPHNEKSTASAVLFRCGGERGIRTLGTVLAFTRFPIVRLRPAHPSLHLLDFYIISQKNKKSSPF